jgi:hypothetical protein
MADDPIGGERFLKVVGRRTDELRSAFLGSPSSQRTLAHEATPAWAASSLGKC